MKRLFLLSVLSILLTTAAGAQDKVWSLEECMHYAVENSPSIKKQEYANANYRQDYISAIANMLPSVSGGVGTGNSYGRSLNPQTNIYEDDSRSFSNSYSISAGLTLFNGFNLINQLRVSKINRLKGKDELQKVTDDISLRVMQNYFDVVYNSGAVRMLADKLEESRLTLRMLKEKEELGLSSSADVAQAEAQLATDDTNLTRQQNMLTNSRVNLKNAMNYPLDKSLPVDTLIRIVPLGNEETPEQLFAFARDNNSSARISSRSLRVSELNYSMSKGRLYPSISFGAGYNTYYNMINGVAVNPFSKQFSGNMGKSFSFSMSIPIFNGLSRRTSVNRSRNYLRIAEQDNAETMRQLQSDIQQAVDDCEGLAKEFMQATKQLNATTLAHRANQRKFEEGLLSQLELQTSANNLLQSRSRLLDVRLRYIIKCRLIDYYKGIPYLEQVKQRGL